MAKLNFITVVLLFVGVHCQIIDIRNHERLDVTENDQAFQVNLADEWQTNNIVCDGHVMNNTIYISVNGYITFGSPLIGAQRYTVADLDQVPEDIFAVYFSDNKLNGDTIGSLHKHVENRCIYITWNDVRAYSDNVSGRNTYQMIFCDDCRLEYRYEKLEWPTALQEFGDYPRIGYNIHGTTMLKQQSFQYVKDLKEAGFGTDSFAIGSVVIPTDDCRGRSDGYHEYDCGRYMYCCQGERKNIFNCNPGSTFYKRGAESYCVEQEVYPCANNPCRTRGNERFRNNGATSRPNFDYYECDFGLVHYRNCPPGGRFDDPVCRNF